MTRCLPETIYCDMDRLLFKQVDNIGLVLFRAVFGLLIAIEGFGAIATGWVQRTLVDPEFTFNFIGFDFLQVFQGQPMYAYFALMGIFGLMVMLGWKYRFAMVGYAILWTGAYLMQKSSYNNHYYLMVLLCWVMALLPANRSFSLDAKFNPSFRSISMPRWCLWILILQVWIVYTYASAAKFYPDWLDATAPKLFMQAKSRYWLIGDFLQQEWVHYTIAYVGILYDGLIVPALLWKRTRFIAFIVSLFFHLFNSVVFQIGIFPYMSIAFSLFFFSPAILRKRFLPKREAYIEDKVIVPRLKSLGITVFTIYFLVQIGLPLRHWFFQDDVLWTEEGHRCSWRMMLRSKSGQLAFWVTDKETGRKEHFKHRDVLSPKQQRSIRAQPDMIWQMAQYIKKVYAERGIDAAVHVNAQVKVNGGPYFPFIDHEVDLANVPWYHFKHNDWILPSPEDYHKWPEGD